MGTGLSSCPGLTPGFHVIFNVIKFFNTNEDATENNWFQKFGKFSGKYHDGVWFSKVVILQSKYCDAKFFPEEKVSLEKTGYVVPDFYKDAARQ